jgi:cytochrome P450
MVIGNIWAIHMDPLRFPNPMAFDPERYLGKNGFHMKGEAESRERAQ